MNKIDNYSLYRYLINEIFRLPIKIKEEKYFYIDYFIFINEIYSETFSIYLCCPYSIFISM